MTNSSDPTLLQLSREILAIAQTGLAFTKDPYDVQRYERLRELAAGLLAPSLSMESLALIELLSREKGYATPKVSTRAAVFKEGRILMVRETSDGLWCLPGGWADVNQSPVECTEREVFEESGYTARCIKLAGVWNDAVHDVRPKFFHEYKLFFLCELTGGEQRTSIETDAIDFFAEDALPPLSKNRVNEEQVARMFDHYRDPSLPTDFDR
jgi:ADP-ribose pyrophosphatase YjhB (NUDIX family)